MSEKDRLRVLQSDLGKTLERVDAIEGYYRQFRSDYPIAGVARDYDLVILADMLSDYYTCLETAFVRIAKHFENELDREKWHKSLLDRMTVEIPGIRKRAIADATHRSLDEIMRFRHFKRYYVERQYNRDRMRLLESEFMESLPLVRRDLLVYVGFLEELVRRLG